MSYAELRRSLQEESSAPWPAGAPRWLLGAVLRGMSREPGLRFPSMRALLGAIDPGRRRRRAIAIVMAGLTATLATTAAVAAHDPCAGAATPIRELWDASARAAVLDAAARTDPSWGEQSGRRLVARFDDVAASWARAAAAVCVAQRPSSAAPRVCLEHAHARFADAIAEAVRGEPALLVAAVARVELLPDPAACIDAPALVAWGDPPPDTHAVVGHLAASELQLGALTVRGEATAYRDAIGEGRSEAEAAIAAAETIGHEPLLARALALAGRLHLGEGDHARAEVLLRLGLAMARRSADAATAAALTADLVYAVSRERTRFREAEDLAHEADGMIEALGRPPLLYARLLAHRASALAHAEDGDHDGAVALHEQAATLLIETLGAEHPATVVALGNIGTALSYASRPAEAEAALQRALAAAVIVWGEQHPRTASLLGSLGLARMRRGALDAAAQDLRRSLQLREAALGGDHPQVDDARYNLASVLRRRGEHAEAAALLQAGTEHVRARLGDDDARLGPPATTRACALRPRARGSRRTARGRGRGRWPSRRAQMRPRRKPTRSGPKSIAGGVTLDRGDDAASLQCIALGRRELIAARRAHEHAAHRRHLRAVARHRELSGHEAIVDAHDVVEHELATGEARARRREAGGARDASSRAAETRRRNGRTPGPISRRLETARRLRQARRWLGAPTGVAARACHRGRRCPRSCGRARGR